jgi:hypothetical protein
MKKYGPKPERWGKRRRARAAISTLCPLCGRPEPLGLNLCIFCHKPACARCIAAGECCRPSASRN